MNGDSLAEDGAKTLLEDSFLPPFRNLDCLVVCLHQSSLIRMFYTISRKNMSQKLSLLLLVFGLIWGLMLLHYTFQQPRHQSSVKLREQILDLSKRYVKALAEENKNTLDVENGASMAGYADLKRTIAVLLDDILQRLVKLENKVDYIVVNGSATNTTNGTSGNLVPVTTNKRISVSGSIR
ncbi:PREDICTED: coiled-coil domain-containing protein 126 [Dipodomys ordii]|uniref:Coiled-coil domain-containing protein 126 n=1 Tax=Dipodomys ordii TaxID=10020 RepID=A0A1S3FVR7_DIPOR|nr:PREDICTED: coiled-coil domain-containing protein 126 [Dipodomys ordii]XP_012879933.1 PREDICTED: coiled-coil domain-containing protein 126 [Dipodomys ordii]